MMFPQERVRAAVLHEAPPAPSQSHFVSRAPPGRSSAAGYPECDRPAKRPKGKPARARTGLCKGGRNSLGAICRLAAGSLRRSLRPLSLFWSLPLPWVEQAPIPDVRLAPRMMPETSLRSSRAAQRPPVVEAECGVAPHARMSRPLPITAPKSMHQYDITPTITR